MATEDLLKTELEYHYGSLKTFNHWDISGEKLITNGNGIYRDYWDNDLIMIEGKVLDGYADGEWKFYYGSDGAFGDPRGMKGRRHEQEKEENPIAGVFRYSRSEGFYSVPEHENWLTSIPSSISGKYYYSSGGLYLEHNSMGSIWYNREGEKSEEYIRKNFTRQIVSRKIYNI